MQLFAVRQYWQSKFSILFSGSKSRSVGHHSRCHLYHVVMHNIVPEKSVHKKGGKEKVAHFFNRNVKKFTCPLMDAVSMLNYSGGFNPVLAGLDDESRGKHAGEVASGFNFL